MDADGVVVASNSSARQLWSTTGSSLVALPFVRLFSLAASASDRPGAPEQWREMKRGGLDRSVVRQISPLDGPPCEVRLRIERSSGGAGSYIATVRPLSR